MCVAIALKSHVFNIYTNIHTYIHTYMYMYMYMYMYIYISMYMSVSLFCSFLTKKQFGTRTFHDVYCPKPLTFHNG